MNKKIIFYVTSFIVLTVICLILHQTNENADIYVAIIASVASVVGVAISVMEIVGVKSKTEAVEDALRQAHVSIGNFLTFSEMKQMSVKIDEIEAYLRSHKNELALIKMKDLKDYLCEARTYIKSSIHQMDDTCFDDELQNVIFNLGMDVHTLQKVVNSSDLINDDIVFKNLENTKDILGHISGIIKSSKI